MPASAYGPTACIETTLDAERTPRAYRTRIGHELDSLRSDSYRPATDVITGRRLHHESVGLLSDRGALECSQTRSRAT